MLAQVTRGSRLLFMDGLGRIVRIGDWKVKQDCIVSNEYSFTTTHIRYAGNYAANGGASGKQQTVLDLPGGEIGNPTTATNGVGQKDTTTEHVGGDVSVTPPFRDVSPKSNDKPSSKGSNISLQLATSIKEVLRKPVAERIDENGEVYTDETGEEDAFDGLYPVGDRMVDGDRISMLHVGAMEYDDLLDWAENFPETCVDVIKELIDEIEFMELEHGYGVANKKGSWRP
jgi:hypothetical protein